MTTLATINPHEVTGLHWEVIDLESSATQVKRVAHLEDLTLYLTCDGQDWFVGDNGWEHKLVRCMTDFVVDDAFYQTPPFLPDGHPRKGIYPPSLSDVWMLTLDTIMI